jgi:hypothetical protein
MRRIILAVVGCAVGSALTTICAGGAGAAAVGPVSAVAAPTGDYTKIVVTFSAPLTPAATYSCNVQVADAVTKNIKIIYPGVSFTADAPAAVRSITVDPISSSTPGPDYVISYDCTQRLATGGYGPGSFSRDAPLNVSLTRPAPQSPPLFALDFGSSR